jgi:hypothetical protein
MSGVGPDAKFMSVLLTFILPDAIIPPSKTQSLPYPKAVPVCQGQAAGAGLQANNKAAEKPRWETGNGRLANGPAGWLDLV